MTPNEGTDAILAILGQCPAGGPLFCRPLCLTADKGPSCTKHYGDAKYSELLRRSVLLRPPYLLRPPIFTTPPPILATLWTLLSGAAPANQTK